MSIHPPHTPPPLPLLFHLALIGQVAQRRPSSAFTVRERVPKVDSTPSPHLPLPLLVSPLSCHRQQGRGAGGEALCPNTRPLLRAPRPELKLRATPEMPTEVGCTRPSHNLA